VPTESQFGRFTTSAPSACLNCACIQLAVFKPLSDATRLCAASFAQVALGAAIAELEVRWITNTWFGFGMP
jgi:hypothetical protein